MKLLIAFLSLSLAHLAAASLVDFGLSILCTTGKVDVLRYNSYGCWCGFGGSGTPVDGIDDCCMHHDHCYDAATKSGACGEITEYTAPYAQRCENRHWVHGAKVKVGTPVCLPEKTKSACGKALCACDHAAAECFAKFPYNGRMKCPHKKFSDVI